MNKIRVTQLAAFAALCTAGMGASPCARADYAVLKSGARLHITGYETVGDHVVLTVQGGSVEITTDQLVSVEPEDQFAPAAAKTDSNAPFADLIHAASQKHGVDEHLIAHVIAVESNFNPKAVSRKQAQGLMQLLPTTAAKYSVANVFDPAQNIDGGTRYLKALLEKYSGDVKLALAAYNAGPDMVARYGGVPPFPETQKYVRAITQKLSQDKATPTLAAITLKN
jgi:Transglycosylase SLT domain